MSEPAAIPPYRRVSASRLIGYERCPRQYYYRYVRFVPAAVRPPLLLGKVVEGAILTVLGNRPPPALDRPAALEEWADSLGRPDLTRRWEAAREEFRASPNREGEWPESTDRELRLMRQGVRFHLREVASWTDETGGDLPGAWALARPAFTPPDAPPFSDQVLHPAGWFQGAFDLIYTTPGGDRIVDLKASGAGSPFSTGYGTQLAAYTWLYRAVRGRSPAGIELWYLAEDEPAVLPLPSDGELADFEARAAALRDRESDQEEDWPAEPAPLPVAGTIWCDLCDFRLLCPRFREEQAPAPSGTPLGDLQEGPGARTVRGAVLSVRPPKPTSSGKLRAQAFLADRTGWREITFWEAAAGEPFSGLRRGQLVEIEGCRARRYRGHVQLSAGEGVQVRPVEGEGAGPPAS